MASVPIFDAVHLERLCDVLADTNDGLSGSEIGKLLRNLGIDDPLPGMTKRYRLFEALHSRQCRDRCGNNVAAFIQSAMNPARYTGKVEYFEEQRHLLNEILAFAGYRLGEDGRIRTGAVATTLTEAEERAGRLRSELQRRGVHHEVLAFCRAELVQKNYFHAVFEATKSVADKIRSRTGLHGDGAGLVDQAFGSGTAGMPFLAFNSLQTSTEQSEQSGLMNLMKGMFGTFRNVTAHAPRVSWEISEQDALDLLTIASFIHRRLDSAIRTPRTA